MSRGLGRVERGCWDIIQRNEYLPTSEIAALVFELFGTEDGEECFFPDKVNKAQASATRRALRSLARKGLIVPLSRRYQDGERRWATVEAAKKYLEQTASIGLL
jgi:hypothetical protein